MDDIKYEINARATTGGRIEISIHAERRAPDAAYDSLAVGYLNELQAAALREQIGCAMHNMRRLQISGN